MMPATRQIKHAVLHLAVVWETDADIAYESAMQMQDSCLL